MVILRTRNKITDFLMILAWASPFNFRTRTVNAKLYSRELLFITLVFRELDDWGLKGATIVGSGPWLYNLVARLSR